MNMPKTEHTPGPWMTPPQKDWRHHCAVVMNDSGSIQVACCYDNHVPRAMAEANARLIAAAPILLAALEGLLRHSGIADAAPEDKDGDDHELEHAAHAAIAAARGER